MIKINGLTKAYQQGEQSVVALDTINLHIAPGEIFGVIGRSGAGKSTLIRCINLLEKPDSGQILINGTDITRLANKPLRQVRRKMSMIFQHFNLLSTRTVFDNVALPLELIHESKSAIHEKVNPLLELTGLINKSQAYPSQLSGGQKQRVAIARALASNPDVLLCDEATSSLDPETTHAILELLSNINKQFNLTILLITHEMDVIKQICNRVALIDNAKIVEVSEPVEFFTQPKSAKAKEFIQKNDVHKLPALFQENLQPKTASGHSLLRITFKGAAAKQPLLSDVVKRFNVTVNILQADIELIHDRPIGVMLLTISGDSNEIDNSLRYLQQLDLTIDLLGKLNDDFLATT